MSNRKISLIVFDVDGVLISGGNEGYFHCFRSALQGVGVYLDHDTEREFLLKNWGLPGPNQIEKILEGKPELIEEATRLYMDYLNSPAFLESLHPINGFPEVISGFSMMGYKLAIASGMESGILNSLMAEYSVAGYFDRILSGYEISDPKHQKPAPYMINRILEELKINPESTIYIGDSETDFIMAVRAKVNFVCALSGNLKEKEAIKLGAKIIVPTVKDLYDNILKIESGL